MDLIQTGSFKKYDKDYIHLTGRQGIVSLEYMGSAEFECGALPNSTRRIMHNFDNYEYYNTGIFTPEHEELIVFCNKDKKDKILKDITDFIEHPYQLKEFTQLERIKTSRKDEKGFNRRMYDFWWCVDYNADWMAFLDTNKRLFELFITKDYRNWWLSKTEEQRETEYQKALKPDIIYII